MPKYSMEGTDADREKRAKAKEIHPIWRGVGFGLIILVPLFSYALTEVILKANQTANWFPLPYDLMAKPTDLFYTGDPLIYIKIIMTITFSLVLFAIFTLVTFIMNSAFGRPRYGPMDVPPINVKVKKRSR
jgi:hypothetical protein